MSTQIDNQTLANGAKEALLREFAPPRLKRLRESQTAIPALAKDDVAARDVEAVLPTLPTRHEMRRADARDLEALPSESVHLVLTSPPYWTLKSTRLIRMFSFVGDTVFDPFLESGATSVAAWQTGRSSLGVEVDDAYLEYAARRFRRHTGTLTSRHHFEVVR